MVKVAAHEAAAAVVNCEGELGGGGGVQDGYDLKKERETFHERD